MAKATKRLLIALLVAVSAVGFAYAGDGMLDVSGFVDASYFGNMNNNSNEFGLDQVEVDLGKTLEEGIALRADIEWVKDGNDWAIDLEQGYLEYRFDFLPTVGFTFGKFNAPIGFELLDAPDMYQFSHSLVFDNCLPTNLTGLMINTNLGYNLDLAAYATNGWDENTETNEVKTYGGRLGYTHCDLFTVGASAILGSFDADQTLSRTVIDIDLGVTPVENLLIGAEYNMGSIDVKDGDTFNWTGFMVMAHYDLNDWFGFTARFDSVDDSDSQLFLNDLGVGLGETRTSLTFAPTFVLGDGIGALIEYRMDSSDQEVFTDSDNEPSKNESVIAFEMTYTF